MTTEADGQISSVSDAPIDSASPGWSESKKSTVKLWVRLALFGLGLAALGALVAKIGVDKIWTALSGAGPLLPVILLLDFAWLSAEGVGALILYGKERRSIPGVAWLEATLVHFATFMVVPVGRASAEVARAGLLGRYVGKAPAAASAALMQAFSLLSNATLSLICFVFVWVAARSPELGWFILLNVGITGGIGGVTYVVLRHIRIGGALGRKFSRLAKVGPEVDRHIQSSRPRHLLALVATFLGRTLQTVQYGVIVIAVVGTASVTDAFTAQGIQLVGRTLGDAVPNQVGVTESAFALGSVALGLLEQPEKAVAIALLARISNLGAAGLCAIVLQFLPRSTKFRDVSKSS